MGSGNEQEVQLKIAVKMGIAGKRKEKLWTRFLTTKLFHHLKQRYLYELKAIRIEKLPWASIDRKLMSVFLSSSIDEHERYSELFSYFVTGLLYYGSPDYTHIYYPGALSSHGATIDAMEGICRVLPMISAWISSGRPSVIRSSKGRQIDLLEIVRGVLLAGTDPKSNGFWGHICDHDQRIVEAADIALSVWLLRKHLWPRLSLREREIISNWLRSVNGRIIPDNNWHLFPVMINEVLSSLDYDGDHASALLHYERFKSFYQGNGWFSDGPNGPYDYYNSWCIHYFLFWINLINPEFDPDFIDNSLNDFVCNFKYFISTDGFPMTGRSVCYRIAVPAPLIAAATKGLTGISPGMARRALDCVWRYFISKKAIYHGRITQGYFEEDLGLLDNYSGPGSSMWSTRSLTLAFYNPPESDFWTAPLECLPIEQDDYEVYIPGIRWEIRGSRSTREVQIIKKDKTGIPSDEIENISLFDKIKIYVFRLPYRAENDFSRYELHRYSSLHPFWLTKSSMDQEVD